MANKDKKQEERGEFPEPGEFILGTVEEIFNQGAFITLDEYNNKRGMLHISEISLKWVKNIRNYVKEGQKVVLKVLDIRPERGHIDLSLRRVSEQQRRAKLEEIKQEQRVDKLIELLANRLEVEEEKIGKEIEKFLEQFDTVYDGLEEVRANNETIKDIGIKEEWEDKFLEAINKNIASPYVNITGYVKLSSYEGDSIDHIKEALNKIEKYNTHLDVSYVSAPLYRIEAEARSYKKAEKLLRNSAQKGIKYLKEKNGEGDFYREWEEQELVS